MCPSFLVWAVCLAHAITENPHQTPGTVPQAGHLRSGLCSLMRFSDCFSSFMEKQAYRAGVGTCSAARASFSSDRGRLLSCLDCVCLRQSWLRCPVSLACIISHRLALGWYAPGYSNFSHFLKSSSLVTLSPSEKQLGFGNGSSGEMRCTDTSDPCLFSP